MVLTPIRHLTAALCLAATLSLGALAARAAPPLDWFDAQGPTAQATVAIELLRQSGDYGLEPADYQAQALADAVSRQAQSGNWNDEARRAHFDAALTESMQRYLSDLQSGRVTPAQVRARFAPPQRPPRVPTTNAVSRADPDPPTRTAGGNPRPSRRRSGSDRRRPWPTPS